MLTWNTTTYCVKRTSVNATWCLPSWQRNFVVFYVPLRWRISKVTRSYVKWAYSDGSERSDWIRAKMILLFSAKRRSRSPPSLDTFCWLRWPAQSYQLLKLFDSIGWILNWRKSLMGGRRGEITFLQFLSMILFSVEQKY